MRLGIMQPYFLPYIGYWQLMNAVDQYVIYDDVNYIKGGWINRNRILINGEAKYINVPLVGASPNKRINEVSINGDDILKKKTHRMVEGAYKKAPYFDVVIHLFDEILFYETDNLAEYLIHSIYLVCEYLQIDTKLLISSGLDNDKSRRGEDKVIDICKHIGADIYVNAIGGKELYSAEHFQKEGIELSFLKSDRGISYSQFHNEYVGDLSILDVMMFQSVPAIREMLKRFTLV